MKLAVPDMISNSYFPAVAAVELGFFREEGLDLELELVFPVDKAYRALRDGAVDFAVEYPRYAAFALRRVALGLPLDRVAERSTFEHLEREQRALDPRCRDVDPEGAASLRVESRSDHVRPWGLGRDGGRFP